MLLKPITISDIETELTFLQPNVFLVLLFVVDVDFILSILEKKIYTYNTPVYDSFGEIK